MKQSGYGQWGRHSYLQWQGENCHWRQLGDMNQPAILLIHGFGTGSGHWRNNAEVIAKAGFCIYAIDLIGFGDSSQPSDKKLDNRFWARQVNVFIRRVIQRPTILVGHSLGGLVALTCSVMFPELIKGVIAVPLPDPTLLMKRAYTPNIVVRRPAFKRKLKRFAITMLCNLLPLELIVPLIVYSPMLDLAIQLAYSCMILGDTELRHIIGNPARKPTASGALRSMSKAMALRPWRATAASLLQHQTIPMYMIWGQNDLIVPLEVAWQCQKMRNDIIVTVIHGAGHCPHDEKPEVFNKAVIDWLKDHHNLRENGGGLRLRDV